MILLIQVVEDGYEFFAKRQLVTLFSAPNYCGEFDNAGAMMSVDETLMCSFQVGSSLRVLAVLCGGVSAYLRPYRWRIGPLVYLSQPPPLLTYHLLLKSSIYCI